jgi:hypothetical protein
VNTVFITKPFIYTIIITIRHQLDPERPASASSNSPFKALPGSLRPFALQFSTALAILLLFILVASRSQFDLHLLSFSSTGSTFSSSKLSSFLLWSTRVRWMF